MILLVFIPLISASAICAFVMFLDTFREFMMNMSSRMPATTWMN